MAGQLLVLRDSADGQPAGKGQRTQRWSPVLSSVKAFPLRTQQSCTRGLPIAVLAPSGWGRDRYSTLRIVRTSAPHRRDIRTRGCPRTASRNPASRCLGDLHVGPCPPPVDPPRVKRGRRLPSANLRRTAPPPTPTLGPRPRHGEMSNVAVDAASRLDRDPAPALELSVWRCREL